ncbi:MAG: aminotransferase class I/II-fold pyridoxal phosphate-dependent enzyme [Mangrovibacterium sp.]|nr:aminotransferase class I/II-fold pyridoxal phosphate-dependent enzyme [Mangrovibacterium sp.]
MSQDLQLMERPEINDLYKFVMESAPAPETVINGKKYLYFGGVGYYQLHNHHEVIRAAIDAIRKFGINSATSISMTGMTRLHFDVERRAAEFFGCDDSVYLPSGYLTNIAGIQALDDMGVFDTIFMDETAHYCNKDGAYSVNRPVFKYRGTGDLKLQIRQHLKPHERPLLVTDGIFPTYGEIAQIPELFKLAVEYDGAVWIDDAHASGILGPNGRGTCDHFHLASDRLFFGSTLSKAFGGFGGVIAGRKEFIQHVRSGNVLKGGSKPTHAAAAASLKGLEIVMHNPKMREDLRNNARSLKDGLKSLGIPTIDNDVPIAAFSTAHGPDMNRIHEELLKRGIFIQLSRYVGADKEGVLRMVVFSTHAPAQIHYLIDTLKEIL